MNKSLETKNLPIIIALVAIITALIVGISSLFSIFLSAKLEEDTWICVTGEWVQHGHPIAPKPVTPCPQ